MPSQNNKRRPGSDRSRGEDQNRRRYGGDDRDYEDGRYDRRDRYDRERYEGRERYGDRERYEDRERFGGSGTRSGKQRSGSRSTAERNNQIRRKSKAEQERFRRKKRRKRILIAVEVLVLLLLVGGAFVLSKLGKLNFVRLGNVTTYADSGPYTNIALFGLDSRQGELDGGVNSDTMIIASISNTTNEVKMVSVYRDTYLQQADGSYSKANSAYCTGGPEAAINMMNKNLDIDIKNYISVNFKALITVIDDLGGIELDITSEEAFWLDGYINETAESAGMTSELLPDENGGTYKLNGVQATAYCRIRYTSGSDFKRTERQRTVISKIIEKTKTSSIFTINKIIDDVFPQISTSLTSAQLLSLAAHAEKYTIGETQGFPYTDKPDWHDPNGAECVVPAGLSKNVQQLHAFLFPDQEYTVSDTVQAINDELIKITGVGEDYGK